MVGGTCTYLMDLERKPYWLRFYEQNRSRDRARPRSTSSPRPDSLASTFSSIYRARTSPRGGLRSPQVTPPCDRLRDTQCRHYDCSHSGSGHRHHQHHQHHQLGGAVAAYYSITLSNLQFSTLKVEREKRKNGHHYSRLEHRSTSPASKTNYDNGFHVRLTKQQSSVHTQGRLLKKRYMRIRINLRSYLLG